MEVLVSSLRDTKSLRGKSVLGFRGLSLEEKNETKSTFTAWQKDSSSKIRTSHSSNL